ncbi:hypothetical protein PY254_16345 [Rhodanobacter sp. AS-Z3]|uniref:hypothetical protein n=1 Tax=Rhodanobacter sp. AS-Z3 TaxID=3031330 RepID=UPI00247A27DC|nr:hypothetical protein [Rhodanobacter sp. AS-Z3]WEN14783.1 hypothetical protein PY254_16345 [Rhodanobacter sp. AS-Z3]
MPPPAEESPSSRASRAPLAEERGVLASGSPRGRAVRAERGTHWLALVVALLLHGAFVVVIWQQMRPPPLAMTASPPASRMLQIRFISGASSRPAPPPMPALAPPPRSRPPPAVHEPARKNAMSLQTHEVPPSDALHLYDINGEPLLPAAASSAAALPGYVQHLPQGDPRIMQHRSPIDYQATRFDTDWGKSSAVDSALQKLVDKTTVKKTIRLPRGIRLHCAMSLAMLAGGCRGDPPPPPSAKDGDERLSMAPARSLDGQAHAPKPPSEQACIEMYRAGKPLEWGCPVDTPNRAVDAELRERAAKAEQVH